jgi:hypothetical protein
MALLQPSRADETMSSRRRFLKSMSGGFGYLALAGIATAEAEKQAAADTGPLAPKLPHFAPRAKRVIFLCMRGGPSHVETFDYKPKLNADNLKPGRNPNCKLFGSQWKFQQHGESGLWISDLFPELAKRADRLCVVNSMHTDSENHPQALEQMHTGSFQFIRPSMGSWVAYGLGTENADLPGFIALNPLTALGGSRYYGSAFLPAVYRATSIGESPKSIKQATVGNLTNPRLNIAAQRRQLDLLQQMNRTAVVDQPADGPLEGVIESFELAFRMQGELPRLLDLSRETKATLDDYGIDQPLTDNFGRQCLLARRFAEAGVRFIEITHEDWDHHGFVAQNMPRRCQEIDRPIAALLDDLARRGLLDDTLVVWGGEFGRTPDDPTQDGRGHNNDGFSMWLAGGGVRGGLAFGRTDDYGYEAVENKVHTHDLHATLLHCLGLDHERLTYRYGGRDFRLTDVHGRVVKEILI